MGAKPLICAEYSSVPAGKGGKSVSVQPQLGDVARVLL
jgi:hypothetical protein